MASINTHLAIAKRYLELNLGKIVDEVAFYDGSVRPDLHPNKMESHYGERGERNDMVKRHKEKVGLKKFLQNNSIDNDELEGEFLHLYADDIYYNKMFSKEYLGSVDLSQFFEDHVYTFMKHESHLKQKYGIGHEMSSLKPELDAAMETWLAGDYQRWGEGGPQGKLLFTQEQLDEYIEYVASVNLEKLQQQILNKSFEMGDDNRQR